MAPRRPRPARVDVSTEIVTELERRQAEAFRLEVRSLAKRYGLDVEDSRPSSTWQRVATPRIPSSSARASADA